MSSVFLKQSRFAHLFWQNLLKYPTKFKVFEHAIACMASEKMPLFEDHCNFP